ncbi:hypothetical protein [Xanthomonas bromi]|uniref:hypothetical protein n=1 Tax=Xanthomonas bromi TaxID=56449 RepID=UPI001428AE2A|nr:hypothetical protein [Xanthomonas bromi]
MAIWLVLIACAYLRAVIGLISHRRQASFNRVDADYRACSLVANAKRQLHTSRCYLYTAKPNGGLHTVISAPVHGWRETTSEDAAEACA